MCIQKGSKVSGIIAKFVFIKVPNPVKLGKIQSSRFLALGRQIHIFVGDREHQRIRI